MDHRKFRAWLLEKKKFNDKLTSDAVSRCRRVERLTEVSLDDAVKSARRLDALFDEVIEKTLNSLSPKYKNRRPYNQLLHAVRLYARFSGQDPPKYRRYTWARPPKK
jgi:hypothetical protein